MFSKSGLHKAIAALALLALLALVGCSGKGGVNRQVVEIGKFLNKNPALAIEKLEKLKREHPETPQILHLLAEANLLLPKKNHLIAAIYLEEAARLTQGRNGAFLKAALEYEKAEDTLSQLKNLGLHLQTHSDDHDAWLQLGQVLLQSEINSHMKLAQQILFKSNTKNIQETQSAQAFLLKELLQDLQDTKISNKAFNTGLAGNAKLKLVEQEPQPIKPIIAVQTVSDTVQVSSYASGLAGKFGGEGPPGIPSPVHENVEPRSSTVEISSPVIKRPSVLEEPAETPGQPEELEDTVVEQAPQPVPSPPASTEIESTSPKHAPDTHEDLLSKGHQAIQQGNFEQAAKIYWQAAVKNGESPEVWFCLSRAFYLSKKLKKAEMMALEATRRNPRNPTYLVQFLRITRDNGNPEIYLQELKHARTLFPNEPFVIMELAKGYETVDQDMRAARLLYIEFLKKHPGHSLCEQAQKAIRRLQE